MNFQLGVQGDYAKYLSDVQMRNWTVLQRDFFPNTYTQFGCTWCPSISGGFWLVFSGDTASSFASQKFPGFNIAGSPGGTLTSWLYTAANTDGSVLIASGTNSGGNTVVYRSTDGGITWTLATLITGFVFTCKGLVWDPVHSLFVFATGGNYSSNPIYTSPDGATWTQRVMFAGSGTMSKLVYGGGSILALDSNGTAFSASINGGLAWGALRSLPIAGCVDAAYTTTYGWTFIGTSQLAVTRNFTSYVTATPYFSGTAVSIASDGVSRYALVGFSTSNLGRGVTYSDDGWITSKYKSLDSSNAGQYIPYRIVYDGLNSWAILGIPNPTGASNKVVFSVSIDL